VTIKAIGTEFYRGTFICVDFSSRSLTQATLATGGGGRLCPRDLLPRTEILFKKEREKIDFLESEDFAELEFSNFQWKIFLNHFQGLNSASVTTHLL
jgi:hypothetical protein